MAFNVNEYWLNRGQGYISEDRLAGPYHRLQERFLFDVIRRGALPTKRILELGCGFGRITKLLSENFPESEITAVDLSPDQIHNAQEYCRGKQNIIFGEYDFYSGAPFPGQNYDLVLAIEVFLHHPAEVVSRLIRDACRISTCLINVDWSEPWPWDTPEHVWVHDYQNLYTLARLQCLTLLLPEKIDGKQQKLFVAGRELPSSVAALDHPNAAPPLPSANLPEDWLYQRQQAELEIKTVIPQGSTSILVDENHWGDARQGLNFRTLPFLERAGQYWGLPVDDQSAILEIDRMRRGGAQYIIFPWHSFWWLDYYRKFSEYLRTMFPCVAHTDLVVVFKLN